MGKNGSQTWKIRETSGNSVLGNRWTPCNEGLSICFLLFQARNNMQGGNGIQKRPLPKKTKQKKH